jgi:hypothetical protein
MAAPSAAEITRELRRGYERWSKNHAKEERSAPKRPRAKKKI